mgnify:CR=1 FL=1
MEESWTRLGLFIRCGYRRFEHLDGWVTVGREHVSKRQKRNPRHPVLLDRTIPSGPVGCVAHSAQALASPYGAGGTHRAAAVQSCSLDLPPASPQRAHRRTTALPIRTGRRNPSDAPGEERADSHRTSGALCAPERVRRCHVITRRWRLGPRVGRSLERSARRADCVTPGG